MKYPIIAVILSSATLLQSQSLRFTGGSLGANLTSISMNLAGPAWETCQVEQLNRTNQTWGVLGNLTLNGSGTGTYTNILASDGYGFYRCQAITNSYFSTNAFGVDVGTLLPGFNFVGNIFTSTDISNVVVSPSNDITAYKWNNTTTNYNLASFDSDNGTWSTTMQLNTADGVLIKVHGAANQTYVFSGIIETNIQKSIPVGYTMQTSPLFKLRTVSTYEVDLLTSSDFGGLSNVPVESPGFATQAQIDLATNSIPTYENYLLTNGAWRVSGSVKDVSLHLSQGFWLQKPATATWSISRPVW